MTIDLWWKSIIFLTKWVGNDLKNEDDLTILITVTSKVTVTITISVTDGVTGRISVANIYFKRLTFNPEGCDPNKNADW